MNKVSRIDVTVNDRDYRWPGVPAGGDIALDGCRRPRLSGRGDRGRADART